MLSQGNRYIVIVNICFFYDQPSTIAWYSQKSVYIPVTNGNKCVKMNKRKRERLLKKRFNSHTMIDSIHNCSNRYVYVIGMTSCGNDLLLEFEPYFTIDGQKRS